METNKILSADILDLLFEGKNKEYGAYQLRKTYNGRLLRAILGMTGVVVLLFCFGFVSGRGKTKAHVDFTEDVALSAAKNETPPPVIPPPQVQKPQPVAQIKFVTTRIVPDKEVPKEVIPPENDKLDDAKIGTVNMDGAKDVGETTPPLSSGNGNVVTAPKQEDDDNKIFIKVEKESEFPGGAAAWLRFLNKNLIFPQEAIDQELSGTVMVRFIVDKDGTVSDVEAISGPETGGIREEVVRVIRKSGKWIPANQNGRPVKSYKQQPVTFHLDPNQ